MCVCMHGCIHTYMHACTHISGASSCGVDSAPNRDGLSAFENLEASLKISFANLCHGPCLTCLMRFLIFALILPLSRRTPLPPHAHTQKLGVIRCLAKRK